MHADQRRPIPPRNGFAGLDLAAEGRRTDSVIAHGLHRNVLVATNLTWEGIVEVEQQRLPPEEIRDFQVRAHTITLHLDPPHSLSWGLTGASRQNTLVPVDSLSLFTAGARLGWCRKQATEALVVTLDARFVAGLADRSAHGAKVEFLNLVAFDDPAITYILRAVQAAMRKRCSTSRLYGESLATALVSHLLSHYAALPLNLKSPTGGLPEVRLRRVLDYIEVHLGEDTSLRQLAEVARLSPDHFATLFRQSVGMPPHRYVLERRIARAKELLASMQLTLTEIGFALGYTSQPHFITMFRKLTGMTPGAYRRLTGRKSGGRHAAVFSSFREES